ncbi:DinB family protein [Flavobacterium sp. 7A]|uniref:DinB family protein n=1 Tax=Flavobacterium sp. 7A TaxID=2940571 RepID=UPI002226E4A8|nr:DinB family protein [Flavobacterium sp. 7A]MCW2120827.1 putative damage-inducible protein DinB [Flavobacterium sp. 7A]
MKVSELTTSEYSNFFSTYIDVLKNEDLIEDLEISLHQFIKFVQNISMDKFDFRYAEGKWTIKDIIQHLIDTERVFSYRAMRISRNDQTSLAGFDENDYVANTDANSRNIQGLLAELSAVRFSTLFLFKSFTDEQLSRMGVASDQSVSVRALGFLIIGHQKHHQHIFQDRYM